MSDRMMSVAEARDTIEALGGFHFETQALTAARTIVHLSEWVERLQNALHEGVGTYIVEVSDLVRDGHLLPGDMESPE